ncbi:MAG: glycosyltransferase [Pusillimonas sp.]
MFALGNMRNPLTLIRNFIKVLLLSRDYDIVHAQFGSICGFLCGFLLSKKKVITLRGSDWHAAELPNMKRRWHHKLQNLLTRLSLPKYDKIVVVSNRMRREVTDRYPKADVLVLPSPVNPNLFFPIDKRQAREKLGLNLAHKIFLFPVVNIRNPIKRPWLVQSVQRSLPNDIEIITASGLPHQKMPLLYNAVDAIILPSFYEGWPNVIKEGLMCNTPFIATDISDLKEISEKFPSCLIIEPTEIDLYNALVNFSPSNETVREAVQGLSLDHLNGMLIRKCYESLWREGV